MIKLSLIYLLSCSDSESDREDDNTTRYSLMILLLSLQGYRYMSQFLRMREIPNVM